MLATMLATGSAIGPTAGAIPVVVAAEIAVVIAALGVAAGFGIAYLRARSRSGTPVPGVVEALRDDLRRLAEEQRSAVGAERDAMVGAALEQLAAVNRRLGEQERALGTRELAGQRELIDQQISAMRADLGKVGELVHSLERDREQKFGELTNELRRQREGVAALAETAQGLREALSNAKTRGQWGERMAEDVLRLAGFVEGVQYRKQRVADGGAGRPDYTFMLPNELVMHMDVKFPLDNYLRYLDAATDLERHQMRDRFLRDVRDRVRELKGRGYLDATDTTVDCLLLFIPNEQVYAFIQEQAQGLLDEALRDKIVLCSPLTLYAVLAVVRQACDNFRLERTSNEILTLLQQFSLQWDKYVDATDSVRRKLDTVVKAFDDLTGTRTRALQRPLDRIATLRREHELAESEPSVLALEA
jgi:DNA recombination protein RmuC